MPNHNENDLAVGTVTNASRLVGTTSPAQALVHILSTRYRCFSGFAQRCSSYSSASDVGIATWRTSALLTRGKVSKGASASTASSRVSANAMPWTTTTGPPTCSTSGGSGTVAPRRTTSTVGASSGWISQVQRM